MRVYLKYVALIGSNNNSAETSIATLSIEAIRHGYQGSPSHQECSRLGGAMVKSTSQPLKTHHH